MGTDKQYLIGEFSEMTGTSIRTLHYYDGTIYLVPIFYFKRKTAGPNRL
ncbi:MerR family DNA-binding transcriptional regulator [Bacillus sp. V3-13]